MILDIKRKKKEKRIQLFGGLIGVCVAVASLFYFFHAEKAEAENQVDQPRQQQPGAGRFVQLHEGAVELMQPQLAQGIFDSKKQKADKGK